MILKCPVCGQDPVDIDRNVATLLLLNGQDIRWRCKSDHLSVTHTEIEEEIGKKYLLFVNRTMLSQVEGA